MNSRTIEQIHPLLDQEKQEQARQYEKEKRLLALCGMFLSLCILLGIYFSGLSSTLAFLFLDKPVFYVYFVDMVFSETCDK